MWQPFTCVLRKVAVVLLADQLLDLACPVDDGRLKPLWRRQKGL
jgi:hypothetical protein